VGGKIQAADESKIRSNRRSNFNANFGGSGGGGNALNQASLIPNGLAAQVARGLILSSESGRVISFLEVDALEQILVSIRVLEIDRQKARTLGVNYRIDADKFSLGSVNVPIGTRFPVVGTDVVSTIGTQGGNLVASYVSDTASLMTAIDVLQQKAVARSVAEPNVLTLTGEEASVLVGGEVPIPSTAIGNVASVQGFDFQSFGVRLDIRPTITEDGRVTLEVAPSIVRPNLGLGNGDVPGFEVQTVQTTARVPAGQSLLLGGLLTFEEGFEERGLPIVSRVPVVGYLFKWEKKLREEKELLFVMTPRLIDETIPQEIPDLPMLESRDHIVSDQLIPQQLESDGVPEVWRTPEPVYPPVVCPPEEKAKIMVIEETAVEDDLAELEAILEKESPVVTPTPPKPQAAPADDAVVPAAPKSNSPADAVMPLRKSGAGFDTDVELPLVHTSPQENVPEVDLVFKIEALLEPMDPIDPEPIAVEDSRPAEPEVAPKEKAGLVTLESISVASVTEAAIVESPDVSLETVEELNSLEALLLSVIKDSNKRIEDSGGDVARRKSIYTAHAVLFPRWYSFSLESSAVMGGSSPWHVMRTVGTLRQRLADFAAYERESEYLQVEATLAAE
jgi:hypothetical protein